MDEKASTMGTRPRFLRFPSSMGHRNTRGWITARAAARLALPVCLVLTGCKNPIETRHEPDVAAIDRGLIAIRKAGCGACHEIPGIDWPNGRLAPSLVGFDDVGLIAGTLPNCPDVLASFIRNPPSVKPGSTMPPMPVTQREAADIAAYLYGLDHD